MLKAISITFLTVFLISPASAGEWREGDLISITYVCKLDSAMKVLNSKSLEEANKVIGVAKSEGSCIFFPAAAPAILVERMASKDMFDGPTEVWSGAIPNYNIGGYFLLEGKAGPHKTGFSI